MGGNKDHQASLSLLARGEVVRQRQLPTSNCVYLVELAAPDGGRGLAIYKPRDGEAPLWDFPDHTLYRREYLSYLVSEALGWHVVPATVLREGPHGLGTMQLFIRAQQGKHYFNLLADHREAMARIALFDCLVNNTDRKGGHCLLDELDRVWAIDHGLTFSAPAKLRTVMWDLSDDPVAPELRSQVSALHALSGLRSSLEEQLAPAEVEAFYRRVDLVLSSDVIPLSTLADRRRPMPWPAI